LNNNWYEILKAAKELSKEGRATFSASDLAVAAGLKDTFPSEIKAGPRTGQMGKGSTAATVAAAWLSKFRKWGYVEVAQKMETGAPRPTFMWKMTPAGLKAEPRDGIKAKFEKIVKAAQFLRDQKGKKVEPEAWKVFLKTLDEVQTQEEEKKQ